MLRTAERIFGTDAFTWSVAGVGYAGEFHLAGMAAMLGGNIRVGLEDNLRVGPRQRAGSNADLVRKAVQIAAVYDREPATPDEARSHLSLKGRAQVEF
jgi:uncharacterized protein (DUF849 family)